jgi:hypothetical protein
MAATFADNYNKQDAAALASMFTKDALQVSSDGLTGVTPGGESKSANGPGLGFFAALIWRSLHYNPPQAYYWSYSRR